MSPPSSPPPTSTPSFAAAAALATSNSSISGTGAPNEGTDRHRVRNGKEGQEPEQRTQGGSTLLPASIDPVLALDLRLRWLEAIVLGVGSSLKVTGKGRATGNFNKAQTQTEQLKNNETLAGLAENVQRKLDGVVEGNEGLGRFMAQCMAIPFSYHPLSNYLRGYIDDQHAHLLTPSFALSETVSPSPPSYNTMSDEEVEALLVEMEPDIRAAERDMREIEVLEGRGVTGAGRLAGLCFSFLHKLGFLMPRGVVGHEELKPRLRAVVEAQKGNIQRVEALERRVAGIVERHAAHVGLLFSSLPWRGADERCWRQVDTLSELFVEWDDTLSAAEDEISRFEREREERRRLGLE